MAVLAKDRRLSKLEFYMNAVKLRKQLIFLMGRDFGIKKRVRDVQFYTKNWTADDTMIFNGLLEKYGLTHAADAYPMWMIEHVREDILRHLSDMMKYITRAYTIWATNKAEADLRRVSQDKAIASCESLLQDMELAVDIFPSKAEKILPYVDAVNREIALLKGWRKADNKKNREL